MLIVPRVRVKVMACRRPRVASRHPRAILAPAGRWGIGPFSRGLAWPRVASRRALGSGRPSARPSARPPARPHEASRSLAPESGRLCSGGHNRDALAVDGSTDSLIRG